MKKKRITNLAVFLIGITVFSIFSCSKENLEKPIANADGDGNIYTPVQIGNQIWLKENLKTTKYNDGTPIANLTSDNDWTFDRQGAYCWYENNAQSYKNVYGALYNWYAASNNKICPKGYRLPTSVEWDVLAQAVGGENVAGGMLKETGTDHWESPNTDATDTFGFKALGGGFRDEVGPFGSIKVRGYWWTRSEYSDMVSAAYYMTYGNKEIFSDGDVKTCGYSVRCIKE